MIKKIIIIFLSMLLLSMNVYAEENNNIEIFDIDGGKIIKIIEQNKADQKIVLNYINNITGYVTQCNPIPDKGYAIRVPLERNIRMENKWVNGWINEVVIILPSEGKVPFLMVFENGSRFLCFNFKGDAEELLKAINFN